jgi:carbon storage regulator CsrA
MLVLSRRVLETIVFPDLDVTVQVLSVRGKGIRLGIQAPPGVVILRQELLPAPAPPPAAPVSLIN